MKKNPEVSIVIRTKNEEKFIGEVLGYLMKQSYKNFEIIIVDSGSEDKTLEVVKRFPIRLIQIKAGEFNFSYALNLGITSARGKYICILSGHSIPISDHWLSDGLKNFGDEKVAGVCGYYSILPIGYISRWLGRQEFFFYGEKKIEHTKWFTNSNSLIRKRLWKIYPFDESLDGAEDYDWASEMIVRGYNIIKDVRFSVFHSHGLVGRPTYRKMLPTWQKWNKKIDKRKRPRKSFTRLVI